MIGLRSVKQAVLALAEVVKTNRVLEEADKPPRDVVLNRCMLGNPGTGERRSFSVQQLADCLSSRETSCEVTIGRALVEAEQAAWNLSPWKLFKKHL